jgi:hypothetical protein
VSLCISGIGRAAAFGAESARTGRYLYVFIALALPAVAVAADAVARRWRLLAPVVLVWLLAGIPGNVDALLQRGARKGRSTSSVEGSSLPCLEYRLRGRCPARHDRSKNSPSRSHSDGSLTELRRAAFPSPRISLRLTPQPPPCSSRSTSKPTRFIRRPAEMHNSPGGSTLGVRGDRDPWGGPSRVHHASRGQVPTSDLQARQSRIHQRGPSIAGSATRGAQRSAHA